MLVTATAATMLAGYRRHYIKHFIQEKKFIHHRQRTDSTHQKNPSTNRFVHHRRRRRVQHITNQPIHKSICTSRTDKGAGFNTNKITHLQIDSHNIEGGEGRPGGGDWGCRRAGQVAADSRRGRLQFHCRSGTAPPQVRRRSTVAPLHTTDVAPPSAPRNQAR